MNFTTDWFVKAHQAAWGAWLVPVLVPRSPVRILEIGSYEGRATCWLLEHIVARHTGSTITCVDAWEGEINGYDCAAAGRRFRANIGETGFADRVSVRRGTSRDMLPKLASGHFDFIYVDGDHTEAGAEFDTREALRLCKSDGIIGWDDIFFPGDDTKKVIAGVERGLADVNCTVVRVDHLAVLFKACL